MFHVLERLLPAAVIAPCDHVRPAVYIGEIGFSIQASRFHQCAPKESNLPLTAYSTFEVLLFRKTLKKRAKKHALSPREFGLAYPASKDSAWRRSGLGSHVTLLTLVELIESAQDIDKAKGGTGAIEVAP